MVDALVAPESAHAARYTRDLTRALVRRAPTGTEVAGIVSSSPPWEYEEIERLVPGLVDLYKTSLSRRELRAAWQLGVTTSPGGGIIHAPTLLAPLRRLPSEGDQVVVTVHDLDAATHPEALPSGEAAWRRAMLKRARRRADAVVATSHALAAELDEKYGFGSRLRVISPAARSGMDVPGDEERRAALALPDTYVLAVGSLDPRTGIPDLLAALSRPGVPDVPLVVVGPAAWGDRHLAATAEALGVRPGRVRVLDGLPDAEYGTVLRHATAFVAPSPRGGDPALLIEAFAAGLPVVHTDAPVFLETAAGAGLAVQASDRAPRPDALADALGRVLEDADLAGRLHVGALDRARAFSWDDAAERVWQLHADL
ncbi:glycosyltransferase family 4 protein [Agromyces sp. MMS24-K17]|uniref:glycosyltransferase family 4 protein n=1 Tax=Agromyces sp. MMS24-K17 TaxID=3372850 RepID=UPI00375445E5